LGRGRWAAISDLMEIGFLLLEPFEQNWPGFFSSGGWI